MLWKSCRQRSLKNSRSDIDSQEEAHLSARYQNLSLPVSPCHQANPIPLLQARALVLLESVARMTETLSTICNWEVGISKRKPSGHLLWKGNVARSRQANDTLSLSSGDSTCRGFNTQG